MDTEQLAPEPSVKKEEETMPEKKAEIQAEGDSPPEQTKNASPKTEPSKINASIINSSFSAAGNIIVGISERTNKRYQDPTEPYNTESSDHKIRHHLHTFNYEKCINGLEQERIAIMASYSFTTLDACTDNLLNHPNLAAYKKKILRFDGKNRNRKDLIFSRFIDDYFNDKNNTAVIVTTDYEPAFTDFIYELRGASFHKTKDHYKSRLEERNNLLLIQLSANVEYFRYFSALGAKSPVPLIEVPYLKGLLVPHLPEEEMDEDKTDSVYAQISVQIQKGLFGSSDAEIYEYIRIALQKNKFRFFEEVAATHETLKKPGGYEEIMLGKRDELNPKRYITHEEPLNIYLIYLGVFFENLTVSEFRELTRLFLTDNKKVYNVGKGQEQRSLLERWELNPDHFYDKVRLKAFYADDMETEVINFDDAALRNSFREYIQSDHAHYAQLQFEFLYTSGLIIEREISPRTLNNLFQLVKHFGKREPDRYVTKLLWDTTIELVWTARQKEQENRETFVQRAMNEEVDFEGLVRQHGLQEFEQRLTTSHNFGRLAALLDELSKESKLRLYIDKYLHQLIDAGFYDAVTELLHRIGSFEIPDWCTWINLLIENGTREAKFKALDYLVNKVCESASIHIDTYFEIICGWVKNDPELKHSPSQFGLTFIIPYLLKNVNKVMYEDYGKWPSEFHYFKALSTAALFSNNVTRLFSWLFTEKIGTTYLMLSQLSGNEIEEAYDFERDMITPLIEELHFMILGTTDHDNETKQTYTDIFLQQFAEAMPKKKLLQYRNFFNKRAEVYYNMIKDLQPGLKKEKQTLIIRRNICKQLQDKLTDLKNNANS